ncbi:MAG: primosomal protein N' [Alphaproteobacteria bacterium]|nr:primosomal protein N' [Alphaproteobacteria bacterium]
MECSDATASSLEDSTLEPPHIDGQRVAVLLPLPLAGPYEYRIKNGIKLKRGDIVTVPLGSRVMTGVVWGKSQDNVEAKKIKAVLDRIDFPGLKESLVDFIDWVAAYSIAPQGAVLRMALNVKGVFEPPKKEAYYSRAKKQTTKYTKKIKITPARERVFKILNNGGSKTARELRDEASVSISVINGLTSAGLIKKTEQLPKNNIKTPDPDHFNINLTVAQKKAVYNLTEIIKNQNFSITLLDGVTGSGKTEVYFEAIAETLRRGRQALILLPEIALTPQWFQRFKRRFGSEPLIWHSDIGLSRRRSGWRAVSKGKVSVVVGARSALYLPFDDLGIVIVDEEHENAYKQMEGVSYHARDMAIVRAKLVVCPVILASATPSLETRINVAKNRYNCVQLPERFGDAQPPKIDFIDMRKEKTTLNNYLSQKLRNALINNLLSREQSLLYLNRSGYAPLTLCRKCGQRIECPHCSAWLVEHRANHKLVCHHCSYNKKAYINCPKCNSSGSLVACGPGVERILEEVKSILPKARVGLMTSDTTKSHNSIINLIKKIESRSLDILIGTQMVAKGHHFPDLTLVGIVDADIGLSGGDLRASERTFQVLNQVAGRAGRASKPGRVIVQTYEPEHPVMLAMASGDREAFMNLEEKNRKIGEWPPYGRLAAIIVSSKDSLAADKTAHQIGRTAPSGPGIRILGPAPAPLSILRGQHRRRLLIKTSREESLQSLIKVWLSKIVIPSRVKVRIDVDPYNFL